MSGFLDPAILFFVFGMAAGALKSNLEIPPQISRFLSLHPLMALGLTFPFNILLGIPLHVHLAHRVHG